MQIHGWGQSVLDQRESSEGLYWMFISNGLFVKMLPPLLHEWVGKSSIFECIPPPGSMWMPVWKFHGKMEKHGCQACFCFSSFSFPSHKCSVGRALHNWLIPLIQKLIYLYRGKAHGWLSAVPNPLPWIIFKFIAGFLLFQGNSAEPMNIEKWLS